MRLVMAREKAVERENRYIVIKRKDVDKYLTPTERDILTNIRTKLLMCRCDDEKSDIRAVVIEEDWPMYEDVWEMVENWVHEQVVTGKLPDTDANRDTSKQPTNKHGMPISQRHG